MMSIQLCAVMRLDLKVLLFYSCKILLFSLGVYFGFKELFLQQVTMHTL